MNALNRWNSPSTVVSPRFSRLFDELFSDTPSRFLGDTTLDRGSWLPAVDVRETENEIVLDVELPGLTKKDIEVSIENNVLTLSGERRFENEQNRDSFHRVERGYGKFTRSFTLSSTVDREKVEAKFNDGVLTIRVPKSETAKARRIEIG